MSRAEPATTRLPPGVRRTLLVVGLGAAMSMVDATIVNVALDTLVRDLGTTVPAAGWVVTAYLLAMAGVVPTVGWLLRRFGPRRTYVAALVLFTVASVGCAVAPSLGVLVSWRVVQGAAGGLLAAGQVILARASDPAHLARALALFGLPLVLGPVAGPVVGGLVLEAVGWRGVFLVVVPFGLAAVALAARHLPRGGDATVAPPDVTGLLAVVAGAVLVTIGATRLGDHGTGDVGAWGGLLGGLVLLALFVRRSARVGNPVLSTRFLLVDPVVRSSAVCTFLLGGLIFGAVVVLPLYFQSGRGEDALTTGLLLVPQGLGSAAGIWWAGRLTDRIGSWTVVAGASVAAVGAAVLAVLPSDVGYPLLCAVLAVRGLGVGLAAMPATTAALRAVGPAHVADVSPVLTLMQRLGGAVFTAVIVLVLAPAPAGGPAFAPAFWWTAAVSALAAVAGLGLALRPGRR